MVVVDVSYFAGVVRMVSSTFDADHNRRFVIRPNQSLSWRDAQVFFLGICLVSLTIALAFTLLGFWPVLPMAGAELIALGGALYVCALRGQRREVISVYGDRIIVEKGRQEPERQWLVKRTWVQIKLLRPEISWYPSRLVIRSCGRDIEVGGFLTEQERECLANDLCRSIGVSSSVMA